jgi:N-methylhydantoinase A
MPQPEIEGNGANARIAERPVYFDGAWLMTPIYARERLHAGDSLTGPALVTEYSSTTVLPPNCNLRVDGYGAMVIRVGQEREND